MSVVLPFNFFLALAPLGTTAIRSKAMLKIYGIRQTEIPHPQSTAGFGTSDRVC
jgi:hypothetical protein